MLRLVIQLRFIAAYRTNITFHGDVSASRNSSKDFDLTPLRGTQRRATSTSRLSQSLAGQRLRNGCAAARGNSRSRSLIGMFMLLGESMESGGQQVGHRTENLGRVPHHAAATVIQTKELHVGTAILDLVPPNNVRFLKIICLTPSFPIRQNVRILADFV